MSKLFLAALVSSLALSCSLPSFAANTSSSDSKMKKAGTAVKNGAMWGPKKVGHGMKCMGNKTKKMFHKGK
jgi:hypothetical protein